MYNISTNKYLQCRKHHAVLQVLLRLYFLAQSGLLLLPPPWHGLLTFQDLAVWWHHQALIPNTLPVLEKEKRGPGSAGEAEAGTSPGRGATLGT